MNNKTIRLEADNKNPSRILIKLGLDETLVTHIQQVPHAQWDASGKVWYMPNTKENVSHLFAIFKGKAWIDYRLLKSNNTENSTTPTAAIPKKVPLPPLNEEIKQKIDKFIKRLQSKRFSENTIKTYSDALRTFLRFHHNIPLSDITNDHVIKFNVEYIVARQYSSAFQNQVVNAIKLFFSEIENSSLQIEVVHRPRREKLLPNVLSKDEIKAILNAPNNIKHKAMLSLIYSCGLRRSELLNLKPHDIDSKRNIVVIKQAKGKKDRIVPLSAKILTLLREYYTSYKPKTWLFEGQNENEKYDERSLSNVLKQSLVKAKISKPVSLHWLRHSYATHLLESGTDLRYIQELLGHNSSRTTEIYTHVSTKNIQQIKSPFDDL